MRIAQTFGGAYGRPERSGPIRESGSHRDEGLARRWSAVRLRRAERLGELIEAMEISLGGLSPNWLADGETRLDSSSGPGEFGFNADVVPQPGVASVTPATGPLSGGKSVVIRGHDFSGATEVMFGGHHAGFTVDSDQQITAVAPSNPPGPVDVTVTTTQGGTSPISAADRFSYVTVVCVVPKLKGKTPKHARELLASAHCTLGLVTKPPHSNHKKLVVKSQSPGPNTTFQSGTPVSVKLGPKPHHKKH